ncbi:MAG: hypothetical protein HY717_03810 [Planctomycetes bacterium]|nr:hypothetical protein [Planctomycetota bacterium]
MMKEKALNPLLPAPYSKMSAAALDEEVTKFEQEFIADQATPLPPSLKAKLKRARRKRGRPRIGKGSKRILVTVERDLLRRSDAFAKKKKLSRAQLIARGLEPILAMNT